MSVSLSNTLAKGLKSSSRSALKLRGRNGIIVNLKTVLTLALECAGLCHAEQISNDMSIQFMENLRLTANTRNAGDVVRMDFVVQTIIVSIYEATTIKSCQGREVEEETLETVR